ncbi:tyrosyl-DNA phosphodiesterase 2-like [Saccostrea echinata]|uniref:tyrosyl-DNA phosphodiesterase 2-like n=1 Tax=Saccostrea echinata TaxID=191078 RepID=UPI002A812F9E|nr:tyrosyl-DNA phosphodiesterase 2-like [Saccostrea echinata]
MKTKYCANNGNITSIQSESNDHDETQKRIRVLSYNIEGLVESTAETRTEEICNIIHRVDPHVVLLQEVIMDTLVILKEKCPEYIVIPARGNDYFVAIMLKMEDLDFQSYSVMPFENTRMGRNLLLARCRIKGVQFIFMTSHLESLLNCSEERKDQLVFCFEAMKSTPMDHTIIFGGDMNLRDRELTELGGVPQGICDVWEATGSRPECRYTWDMAINTNIDFGPNNPRFPAQKRFDRIYMRDSNPRTVNPVYFEFVGLEEISSIEEFPSDHWGLLTHYDIIQDFFDLQMSTYSEAQRYIN